MAEYAKNALSRYRSENPDAALQQLSLGAGAGGGGGVYTTQLPGSKNETTAYQYDPFQKFLQGLIAKQTESQGGVVPDFTMAALENFTKNPSAAASFFPQLAAPLLDAQRDAQKRQTSDVVDTFRKAGGTSGGALQSGAFAQAGRQLAADQGRQQQQLLASTYIPLTQQLSTNMQGAINSGLNLPQSTLSSLASLYGAIKPSSSTTQGRYVNAGFEPTKAAVDPFGLFS